ncbi:unnamed protein product, partial [Rotaria sp. Silwood1]
MVSRYRDIIETNQTNFSRQPSIIITTPSIRHGSTSEINVDTVSINDSTSITNNQNNDESTVIDDNNEVNKINLQSTNKNSIDINNTSATATQYEFSHILTKTLVGSHGQELLPSGLHALKQTASIVELVMLLFNEGRLLSHTSKDHVVKVANETDFIVNPQTTVERKSEEQLCEHFITAARQRHQVIALRLQEKFLMMMINDKTIYLNNDDDRLIRNPNGSIHNEATQKSSFNGINDDIIIYFIQEENLLKQLKQQKIENFNQTITDDDEILQVDEKDLDQDFSGPIRFSTECSLICGINIIRGTSAMTHNVMLFDADEYDESYIKI